MKHSKGLFLTLCFLIGCSTSQNLSQESACERVQTLTVQIKNYEASISAAQNGLQASASSGDTSEQTRRIQTLSEQVERTREELNSAVQKCEAGN